VKILVSIVLLALTFAVQAGTPEWYEGSVVLKSSEVLQGSLSVHPVYDMILFKSGDKPVAVYTADKIRSVYYYDPNSNINRKFVSVHQRVNAFAANHLYEIVLFGEIKVLRRIASGFADPQDDKNGYEYYVTKGEELIPFHKFRAEVYPQLINNSQALIRYMHVRKLSPNQQADIIRIVDFYNKDVRSRSVLASASG
jgi:hypothetical protein